MHLDITEREHHDVNMRTTVTLDDDLAEQILDLAHRRKEPFKTVLNESLRRGLSGGGPPRGQKPFVVRARPMRLRAGLDEAKLSQIAEELEDAGRITSHKRQR